MAGHPIGAIQERDTCVFARVGVNPVGAHGVILGVTVAVLLAVPAPTLFTAETLKS